MNLDGKYAKCQGAGITLRDIRKLKSLAHSESEISCKVMGGNINVIAAAVVWSQESVWKCRIGF